MPRQTGLVAIAAASAAAATTAVAAATSAATTAAVAATTTAAAVAATTSAAAATTVAATTSAASAAATVFSWASFIDGQRPTFVFLFVQTVDGRLSFFVRAHFDKTETFAAASITIRDDLSTINGTVLTEQRFEVRTRNIEAQVSAIQFPSQRLTPRQGLTTRHLLSGPKRKRPAWRPTKWDERKLDAGVTGTANSMKR